jgi:hypothetical protein
MIDQANFAATLYRSTKSLYFDGLSDYMFIWYALFDTFPITRNDAVTINVWVKSEKASGATEQVIMSRWKPGGALWVNEGGWRIYIRDLQVGAGNPLVSRALSFFLCTNMITGIWIYSQSPFPTNTWTMVTLTFSGSQKASGLKMYWDGVQQSTYTALDTWGSDIVNSNAYSHLMWGTQYTAYPNLIYQWPPIPTYWFEGVMDETTLWQHEFTAAEVARLFRSGNPQSSLNVGLPSGKNVDTHFRMGELSDGTPYGGLKVSHGRYPVAGTYRDALWNNVGAARVIEDVAS